VANKKPGPKKKRLLRKAQSNRRVPGWVMIRTLRRFRQHPKRHQWRRSRIKR